MGAMAVVTLGLLFSNTRMRSAMELSPLPSIKPSSDISPSVSTQPPCFAVGNSSQTSPDGAKNVKPLSPFITGTLDYLVTCNRFCNRAESMHRKKHQNCFLNNAILRVSFKCKAKDKSELPQCCRGWVSLFEWSQGMD